MTANLRFRFSIARPMVGVFVSALAFALLRPLWPAALFVAIALTTPILVSGLTRAEVAAILMIVALFLSILIPAMQHSNCREPAARSVVKATAPVATSDAAPGGITPRTPTAAAP